MKGLKVAEAEIGRVRVFALDVPGAGPAWTEPEHPDWRLPAALGLERLDARDVQVFAASDLEGMALSDFLAEGYDIGADQLGPARGALDGAGGVIAILRSGAFGGQGAEITLSPDARLIGLFTEPGVAPSLTEIGDFESARPRPAAAAPQEDEDADEDADDPVIDTAVVERFHPDRDTYIRSHLWLAAVGMVGATLVLYMLGNPDYWIGAVAGLLAIGVRGAYLASDELGMRWDLTETTISAVSADAARARTVRLAEVDKVRRLGSAVQLVTKTGDKFLMKYLADPLAVQERLARAAGVPFP